MLDDIDSLHNDMARLQKCIDRKVGAVEARLGEQAIRQKIAALRSKSVKNGCTVEESLSAKRAADRLESKLKAGLVQPVQDQWGV